MKPSGAHVKLGGHEFLIDEEVGDRGSTYIPHYLHAGQTLLANRTNIDGKPGRQNVQPWVFYYAQDDWSGGNGTKFYNPNQTTKFYRGSGNPRVPGYLAAQPTRTDSVSPTGALMLAPCYASGGGFLYMANSDTVDVGHTPKLYQTSDLLTWKSAEASEGASGAPSWNRNLACDQNGNAYLVLGNPTTINRIIRFKGDDLSSGIFHRETDHPTGSNLGARGAAVHEIFLYVWTGINLYQWDTTAGRPVTPTKVGSAGLDNVTTLIATADIVNCGDGVVMFTSQAGGSNRVYQFRRTSSGNTTFNGGTGVTRVDLAFSQLWTAPPDAILWSIAYYNGVVYVSGNQDKGVTVWGIDLSTGKSSPVARISPDVDGANV